MDRLCHHLIFKDLTTDRWHCHFLRSHCCSYYIAEKSQAIKALQQQPFAVTVLEAIATGKTCKQMLHATMRHCKR
eukprot:6468775-Amphidinium_carterae.1